MNQSKVHSQGAVPFSWENKPGVCKDTTSPKLSGEDCFLQKLLPPPPCPPEISRISIHDSKIPPPPCSSHPPSRTCSRRGVKKSDDPFLAAYKECTKSTRKSKKGKGWSGLQKGMFIFSCKRSCSVTVRDNNLVKISQLPLQRDR